MEALRFKMRPKVDSCMVYEVYNSFKYRVNFSSSVYAPYCNWRDFAFNRLSYRRAASSRVRRVDFNKLRLIISLPRSSLSNRRFSCTPSRRQNCMKFSMLSREKKLRRAAFSQQRPFITGIGCNANRSLTDVDMELGSIDNVLTS